MEENQTIEELVMGCTLYFEENCYTKLRIERYKSMWKNGIFRYMKDNGICCYDRSVGEGFIRNRISTRVTPGERDVIRSVNVLNEWQETGKVSKRTVHPKVWKLTGNIGEAIENLLHHLKGLRRSQGTINDHLLYLYRFNQYLENEGISLLEDICERHVLSFVSTLTNNRINVVSSLRVFFQHLYVERILKVDLSYVLANYKWVKREKLPSYYTEEEVKQIESTVSCSSGVGKRDYAVLLLATRLGLRASDIAGLSFSHLDWEKSRIVLKQYKTGKEIELPLLAETGGAIINYLKFGRPRSDSAHVFLSARAPYRPMTSQAVSCAVRYIIDASGIAIGQRRHGPHSMRHSLASRLLEHSVSLPVISETLGHKTTETTMTYLRIDTTALRRCALDVPPVDAAWILLEFDKFFIGIQMENLCITRSIIEQWRKTRINDCEHTLYAKYSVWSQFCKYLCHTGCECYIPRLPKAPDKNSFTPYIFSHKQMADIFRTYDSMRLYDKHMSTILFVMPAILRLMYGTGIRVSEALSVRNRDVDFEKHCILIRKTKNGEQRLALLSDTLQNVLEEYVANRNRMPIAQIGDNGNYFFVSPNGTFCRAGSIYNWFKKVLSECGIPHIGNHHGPRMHDLRHTFAVHSMMQMVKSGHDMYYSLPVLSTFMGHKSIGATERYVRLTAEMYPKLLNDERKLCSYVFPQIKIEEQDGND